MHFYFVKQSLAFPRSSGHDVHSFHMMRALGELGHTLSLGTFSPVSKEAVAGLPLTNQDDLREWETEDGPAFPISRLQRKFCSYWGTPERRIRAVARAVEHANADVVVTVGLEVLPYFLGVQDRYCIWYAADEWFWHHWTLLRFGDPATWSNLKTGLIKGLYERAFRSRMKRAWVVSNHDRMAMRLVAGVGDVDVLPNGVDAEFFQTTPADQDQKTCTFWGRLDFEPNVDAVSWFCERVWPQVHKRNPEATFFLYGFQPNQKIMELAQQPGVVLRADLPDLRAEISRHPIVVLPFVSGAGIKNKLLEAASMQRTIVASQTACNGIEDSGKSVIAVARTPREWVAKLEELWNDPEKRRQMGSAARNWVIENHSWLATAKRAAAPLLDVDLNNKPVTLEQTQ